MRREGFTLIELILVIAVLGVLAVSALPKFIDVVARADTSAMQGTAGAVRSGIAMYRANALVVGGSGSYPSSLNSPPAVCCFSVVLENALDDTANWSTNGAGTVFTYNNGEISGTWTYTAADGTFICTSGTCD